MKQRAFTPARRPRALGEVYTRRAVGGLALIVMHEIDALVRHGVEVRERLAVARQARGPLQLLREQLDLLAETRARLSLDQRERLALLHSWVTDLRDGLREAA